MTIRENLEHLEREILKIQLHCERLQDYVRNTLDLIEEGMIEDIKYEKI